DRVLRGWSVSEIVARKPVPVPLVRPATLEELPNVWNTLPMDIKSAKAAGDHSAELLQFWQHEATALEVRAGGEAKKALSCLTLSIAFVGGGLAISMSSSSEDLFFGASPLGLAGAGVFAVLAVVGLLFWMEWMRLLAKSFQANIHVANLL